MSYSGPQYPGVAPPADQRAQAFEELPGHFQPFDHAEIAGVLAERGGGSRYLVQIWAWYRARAHWDGQHHTRGKHWTSATREDCAADCGVSVRTVSRARKLLSDAGALFAHVDHWGHTHTWVGPWRPDPALSPRKERRDRTVPTCFDPDPCNGINGRATDTPPARASNPTRPGIMPDSEAPTSREPTLDGESVKISEALEELEDRWPGRGQGDAMYVKWRYSRDNARAALRKTLATMLFADLYADARAYLDEIGRLYCVPLDTWLRFTRERYKARNPRAFPPAEVQQRLEGARTRIQLRRRRAESERRAAAHHKAAWRAMVERPGDARGIARSMVRRIEAEQDRRPSSLGRTVARVASQATRPPPPPPRAERLARTVQSGCLNLLAMVLDGKMTAAEADAEAERIHREGGLVGRPGATPSG